MAKLNEIEVLKLDEQATLPTRTHSTDAGLDLYALDDTFIPLGETTLVKTGIAINIPEGYVGLIRERSGVGRKGLKVAGGVIDSGYSGDCSILLMNISNKEGSEHIDDHSYITQEGYWVESGDRVAQLILIPIETPTIKEVKTLWGSKRGAKAFNSSGR